MKLLRSLLMCALLGPLPHLHAQKAAPAAKSEAPPAKKADTATAKKAETGSTAQTDAAKAKEAAAAAKATAAEERKIVHTLAVMEFKIGRESGQVMFELFPADAPKTVENFRANADKGIYDGLAVHRAVKDYLVQTGDPASRDDRARETWGLSQEYTIPGEFKRVHVPGAVAMARRGDNVNPGRKSDGTQFYFVLGNMSTLDGQYTVFGQVVSGMEVLKKISRGVTDSNDCPVVRVEIKKLKVVEQKGPMVTMVTTPGGTKKKITRPDALKGPFERFIERIW